MKINNGKDFWAGIMFTGTGIFFMIASRAFPMGTAVRMGPAYFPTVLGGMLAVLGAIVMFDSFVLTGDKVAKLHFRPLLFVMVSSLAFAYLLKPLGLVLASIALIFVSAFGGHEFKWKEVAILSVVLVIFSVLVFVKGLTLPFPICPSFIDNCPIR